MPPLTEKKDTKLYALTRGKHAELVLGFISLVESWFMPIVVEPFMILPILARPRKWFRITTVATIASVAGGILGYLTGMLFFDVVGARLIELYGAGEYLEKTTVAFNDNVFWVIFAGAFTPLPYKVFTLIGGFLRVDFFMFLLATLVGRGLRFYAVGFVLGKFGEHSLSVFVKHLRTSVAVVGVVIVSYVLYVLF